MKLISINTDTKETLLEGKEQSINNLREFTNDELVNTSLAILLANFNFWDLQVFWNTEFPSYCLQ